MFGNNCYSGIHKLERDLRIYIVYGIFCGELKQMAPHVAACLFEKRGQSSFRGLQNKCMPLPEVHTRWVLHTTVGCTGSVRLGGPTVNFRKTVTHTAEAGNCDPHWVS
jgi:hypothetical protein